MARGYQSIRAAFRWEATPRRGLRQSNCLMRKFFIDLN
jgi:hypothetical protein